MNPSVFPEDSWVEVRYPLTSEQEQGDRGAWPWLPGWVVSQCGPDEWQICVQAPELAAQHEGETVYPVCFRDPSELRVPAAEPDAGAVGGFSGPTTADGVMTEAEAARIQAEAAARGYMVWIDARIVPALPRPAPEPDAGSVPEPEAGS